MPGGVVHVATDGSIVEANAEALRILGYRFDDLTQRFIVDFETTTVLDDGSPCPVSEYPVAKVLATGEPQGPLTIGVRRPDGATSWAVFRAAPARDESGALVGAVVTFIDITERKQAETELRRSEQKWRLLAQNHPDFVVVANRDLEIESINRVYPPYDAEKVIGTSAVAYIHPDHLDDWRRCWAQAIDTRRTVTFETRVLIPGGDDIWCETVLVPLPDEDRVLLVARDVTTRRAMMATLAEKERLASVGMLAASVAHEIMNPLTYVLANLDFAVSERCPPGPRQHQALGAAREGAVRMQQIVWDLRALARPGGEDLFYVDVRAVLETALRLAGPEVAKNVGVKLELEEVPGVLASESRLCQVFINLLVNAAHAMAERPLGEREIRVRTRTEDAAALVGVDIADTGSGIRPEHLPRIFDPFFTTKRTGTGLGLSISKDCVERMGGRIDVVSQPGRGTTFTVWLSTTRLHVPASRQ
jgi:PAS domain S-box-containing protein